MKKLIILILLILLFASNGWGTNWWVRDAASEYGAEDGTSYATAFDGSAGITWGVGGVVAGDTLYICGDFNLSAYFNIDNSGTSGSEITIDFNCPESVGSLDGGGTTNYGILVSAKNYLIINSAVITNFTRRGIYLPNAGNLGNTERHIQINNSNITAILSGDANDSHGIQFWGTDITITGGTISNIGTDGIWGDGLNATLTNNNISNVSVDDNGGDCIQMEEYIDGAIVTGNILDHSSKDVKQALILQAVENIGTAAILVSNNTMIGYENGATSKTVFLAYPHNAAEHFIFKNNSIQYGSVGLWLEAGAMSVSGNVISDPTTRAVEVNTGVYPVSLVNNTIVSPSYGETGIYVESTASGTVDITNNIVMGFSVDGIKVHSGAGSVTESYNCSNSNNVNFADENGAVGAGANSITSDPLFVNAAAGNFRLQSGSPAIDAGVLIAAFHVAGWQDYEGKTRLYGDGVDIGAIEKRQFKQSMPLFFPWGSDPIFADWYASVSGDVILWSSGGDTILWATGGDTVTW